MQYHLRSLLLIVAVIVICAAMIGRITKGGSLVVSQTNLPYVERVLSKHGIRSWTGVSSLGGSLVTFHNPFALTSVDEYMVEDAKLHNYYIEIRYDALMPIFNSTKIINAEIGMFGEG